MKEDGVRNRTSGGTKESEGNTIPEEHYHINNNINIISGDEKQQFNSASDNGIINSVQNNNLDNNDARNI